MEVDKATLEHALEQIAEVYASIEVQGNQLIVSGIVSTVEERQATLDVVHGLAPEAEVVDNLAVEGVLPEQVGDMELSEADLGGFAGATADTQDTESLEPGDFTDQDIMHDAGSASGPSGTRANDSTEEGERVTVPPTDPVRTPEGEILGGFQTTSDEDDTAPRSEVLPGPPDEGIIETIQEELSQDAATTALDIEVSSRGGIVVLRGMVDDLEDAQNAQAVASRVQGVVEVWDQLELRAG